MCLFSCEMRRGGEIKYNLNDVSIFQDSVFLDASKATNALDNIIYIPKRNFVFDYCIYVKNDKQQKCHKIQIVQNYNESKGLMGYDYVYRLEGDSFDDIIYNINLYVYNTKTLTSGVTSDQVAYFYTEKNGDILAPFTEFTSVKETNEKVFLHPFRSSYFKILELYEFPTVYMNKEFVKSTLTLDDEMKKLLSLPLEISSFNHTLSKELELVFIDTPFKTSLECIVLNGESVNEDLNIRTTCRYYFNMKYGFIKSEYILLNGDRLEVTLENVVDDYKYFLK